MFELEPFHRFFKMLFCTHDWTLYYTSIEGEATKYHYICVNCGDLKHTYTKLPDGSKKST